MYKLLTQACALHNSLPSQNTGNNVNGVFLGQKYCVEASVVMKSLFDCLLSMF